MERIGLIGKRIARGLSVASLGGELGYTGATNVHGEQVKKLDEWANEVFLDDLRARLSGLQPDFRGDGGAAPLLINCRENSYCVLYDPIDGSSNTDVNGSLGTIFAVKKRAPEHAKGIADILTPGSQQVVAGYVLYGPAAQLVYTRGRGRRHFHARSKPRRVHSVARKREDAARTGVSTPSTRPMRQSGMRVRANSSRISPAAKTNAPAIRCATAAHSPPTSIDACSRAESTCIPAKSPRAARPRASCA